VDCGSIFDGFLGDVNEHLCIANTQPEVFGVVIVVLQSAQRGMIFLDLVRRNIAVCSLEVS
jgi:hypothetical protein